MFDKIQNIYHKYLAKEKIRTYYRERGIDASGIDKMSIQDIVTSLHEMSNKLEKENNNYKSKLEKYESENVTLQTENEKTEKLEIYFETQGLDPVEKDENLLQNIATNLQASSESLSSQQEAFKNKFKEYELESVKLKKENEMLIKRIEVQKQNIGIFSNTLESYFNQENKEQDINHTINKEGTKELNTGLIMNTLESYCKERGMESQENSIER